MTELNSPKANEKMSSGMRRTLTTWATGVLQKMLLIKSKMFLSLLIYGFFVFSFFFNAYVVSSVSNILTPIHIVYPWQGFFLN